MLLAVNSPLENIHFHQLCMSKKMIHPQDLQNCNFLQLNWYQTTKKEFVNKNMELVKFHAFEMY